MKRVPHFLIALGLLCCLTALIGMLVPANAGAAVRSSVGTPTPPPPPTPEVTPSVTPPVTPPATPPVTPPVTPPTNTPTLSPTPPRSTHTDPPPEDPTLTPEPPTTTPESWTTDIAIEKRVDTQLVNIGQLVHYSLIARNTGAHTAFDVVVTDDVPSALEIVEIASSKGDIVAEGQRVIAYVSTLEPNEAVTITITARVLPGARGTISNTGAITTTTPGDDPGNNTSTVTIELLPPKTTPPRRLPPTNETLLGQDVPLLTSIPPAAWLGLVGLLVLLLGLCLRWAFRARWRPLPALAGAGASPGESDAGPSNFVLPPDEPVGEPRLGPELPGPAEVAPLPPPTRLDRDDALRDALTQPEV